MNHYINHKPVTFLSQILYCFNNLLEHTRLSVWIQSGEAHIKDLMKFVITKETIHHTLIVLCVDLSKPWDMLDHLENYMNILREHLHSLNISAKISNELEKQGLFLSTNYKIQHSFDFYNFFLCDIAIIYYFISVLRDFHSYKYNELTDESSKRLSTNLEQDEAEMSQLAENVILDNIGLPIVVAVTKVV